MERGFGSRLPQRFENVGTNCALLRLPLVSARVDAPLRPLACGQSFSPAPGCRERRSRATVCTCAVAAGISPDAPPQLTTPRCQCGSPRDGTQ